MEYDCLVEAERALNEGLDLIRWMGEYSAHKTGYTALARLRTILGDRPAMLAAVQTLEEISPEGVFYVQALRHRLSMRHWPDDPEVRKDAQIWLNQSGIEFAELAVIHTVDSTGETYFQSYLGAAHVLACLAKGKPGTYPLEDVYAYLERQQDFAASHGFASWVGEIAIARTLPSKGPPAANTVADTNAAIAINYASIEDLQRLPRVGPVLAARIIAQRQAGGPFRSAADLQRLPGIGPRTAARLAPLLRFD